MNSVVTHFVLKLSCTIAGPALFFGKKLSHTIIMLFSKEHKEKVEVLTAMTKSSAIMCHQISDTV